MAGIANFWPKTMLQYFLQMILSANEGNFGIKTRLSHVRHFDEMDPDFMVLVRVTYQRVLTSKMIRIHEVAPLVYISMFSS